MEDWLSIVIVIAASALLIWVAIALAVSKNRHERVRGDLEVEREKVKATNTELERVRNSLTPEVIVDIVYEAERLGYKNPNAVIFGIVKAATAAKLNTGALAVGMKGYSEELRRRVAEMEETLKLNESSLWDHIEKLVREKERLEREIPEFEKRRRELTSTSQKEIGGLEESTSRAEEYSAIVHQLLEYKDHED